MAFSITEIARFGPDAQRQVLEALKQGRKPVPVAGSRVQSGILPRSEFDSGHEYAFYLSEIVPGIQSGKISSWEAHRVFELFPASEYSGNRLPRNVFKPDFLIQYANGHIEVVETKDHAIRKLQRDYPLRRRLFIEKYCRPNGWGFRELVHNKPERRKPNGK